jgi:hypothetical protein
MTETQITQDTTHHRAGLTQDGIFRLWKAAIKDDEKLLDDAIADAYDQMISSDRARAERVISLIIRRHREARDALKALLSDLSKHRQNNLSLRVAC